MLAKSRVDGLGVRPMWFCSSKTRAEIESLRKAVGAHDPFIVENCGAIYAPEGYFPFAVGDSLSRDGSVSATTRTTPQC